MRLYALVRGDLLMDAGKIASQAGHAYVGAAVECQEHFPRILADYHKDFPHSPGTKVCLRVKSLDALLQAEDKALKSGLPVFKVIDSGCSSFYGGEPIVTALGIGPAYRYQVPFLKKHQLLTKANT